MQSLPLRPLKLAELKELAEREEDLERGKAEEKVDEEEVDEEEEEMLETRRKKKKKKKLRISGTRRRRGGRSCTLGGLLLGLLLLGCLAMGVVFALKMLQVPVDYGAPLRETRAAFETVRSPSIFNDFTEGGDTSKDQSPPTPPPFLLLPLARLRSILASRNTTLEAVAAKYCTTATTPQRVNNVENNITNTNTSAKADDSELLPPPPLLTSCSTINWPLLADQIRAVLVQKGSAVQVSLSEEGGDGDEGDEGDHHQTLHLSIGYLPPSGGSLSILKTGGGNQLFQVEMASSEHEPEVRLEVAWILPLLTGSGGGKGESDADAGIITLLMVTPDRRHCLLELFGPRQLSCKLS
ncbi:hypothetical protein TYRP_019420 [Tyrophagus putrescentiae]|nr:hypothetical protein TYRP_019420 [Tyrophagus putrescentiae]